MGLLVGLTRRHPARHLCLMKRKQKPARVAWSPPSRGITADLSPTLPRYVFLNKGLTPPMKIWPLLLLLGGCATSLDTLIEQRSVCLADGCPDELHIEIDRKEAIIQKRAEIKAAWEQQTHCSEGYFLCVDAWCQERRKRQMPKPRANFSGCTTGGIFIW